MNAITQQDPMGKLRGQLTAMTPELRSALPDHIKPEKFARVVTTVVQLQPDLLQADRRTLLGACMRCAADGLVPDGREAALVIFNTKQKIDGKEQWIKAVQYMPMMAGLLKKIRNSDAVASIQAHVIYQNDKFLIRRGITDTLEHEPLFPGDRGAAIGAYAVAKFKDGSDPQFEIMDRAQIEKVRQVSKAANGGPWTQHWDEMARKTVFRRLSKWLPMDAEVETAMRRDDEYGTDQEDSKTIDAIVGDDTPALSAPITTRLDQMEDALTGEIVDADPPAAQTKPGGGTDTPDRIALFVADAGRAATDARTLDDVDAWEQRHQNEIDDLPKPEREQVEKALNDRRTALARGKRA